MTTIVYPDIDVDLDHSDVDKYVLFEYPDPDPDPDSEFEGYRSLNLKTHSNAVEKFLNAAELLSTCGLNVCVAVTAPQLVQFWASSPWRDDLKDVMRQSANLQAGLDLENKKVDMFVKSKTCKRKPIKVQRDRPSYNNNKDELATESTVVTTSTTGATNNDNVDTIDTVVMMAPESTEGVRLFSGDTEVQGDDTVADHPTVDNSNRDDDPTGNTDKDGEMDSMVYVEVEVDMEGNIILCEEVKTGNFEPPKPEIKDELNPVPQSTMNPEPRTESKPKIVRKRKPKPPPAPTKLPEPVVDPDDPLQLSLFKPESLIFPALMNTKLPPKKRIRVRTKIRPTEKKFLCNECGFATAWQDSLTSHTRRHTGEKPHACHLCEARFGDPSQLIRHLRVHTGERPFQCKLCPYSSAQSSYLRQHMRRHTGEKPYKCDHCDYRTAHTKCLMAHVRTHTGETFDCPHCQYKTNRDDNLLKHVRASHRNLIIVHTDEPKME